MTTASDLSKTDELQTHFLQFAENKTGTCIYLANGIKLQGKIVAHDQSTIVLEDTNGRCQMVYKRSISTVVPHACNLADLQKAAQA